MSAPDQLGSDKLNGISVKLGRELLPAPESPLFEGLCLCLLLEFLWTKSKRKRQKEKNRNSRKNRKTRLGQ
jgi:hypothetical protein